MPTPFVCYARVRERDARGGGLCHAPAFPCPVEAQTRPPFVHKRGRDKRGSGGGSCARCPVRLSGGEGRKGRVRTFCAPPYIPRLRTEGWREPRARKGEESGRPHPAPPAHRGGGVNGGAHRWGSRGKRGRGHAKAVCMPPPPL